MIREHGHGRQCFPLLPLLCSDAPPQILRNPLVGSLFTARHPSMVVPRISPLCLFTLYVLFSFYTLFNRTGTGPRISFR
jgi:hypothetical protein